MAGYGMVRFYLRHRSPHWRRHLAISLIGGTYAALVVLIFAVVKFTEGAFVVVILFPVMVYALIRVNREYRMEAHVLEDIGSRDEPPTPPTYARRTVFVFVDEFDLATLAGLRYARSLRPTSLRAVHFIIDSATATKLREDWLRAKTGVSLDLVDCPDRRLTRGVAEMVQAEAVLPGVGVTAVLPRRTYSPFFGRLIHDRTADQIAAVVSQIPHAAATIVPFDVRRRVESLVAKDREHFPRGEVVAAPEAALADGVAPPPAPAGVPPVPAKDGADYNRPAPSSLATPIADLPARGKAVVEGRVHAVEIRPVEQNNVLAAEIMDST